MNSLNGLFSFVNKIITYARSLKSTKERGGERERKKQK